jgi:hypothetical protein
VREARRLDLMRVGLHDAEPLVGLNEIGMDPFRPGKGSGSASGDEPDVTQLLRMRTASEERNEGIVLRH